MFFHPPLKLPLYSLLTTRLITTKRKSSKTAKCIYLKKLIIRLARFKLLLLANTKLMMVDKKVS